MIFSTFISRLSRFSVLDHLRHGQLLLCFSAFSSAYVFTVIIVGQPFSIQAAVLPALLVWINYTFDAVCGHRGEDESNKPGRVAYVAVMGKWQLRGAVILLVGLLIGAFSHSRALGMAVLAPEFALALYSGLGARFLPSWRWARIKDVCLLKNIFTAISWSFTLVVIPLIYLGESLSAKAWWVMAYMLVRGLFEAIACDIGDADGDRLRGIVTLPVVLGRRRTLYFLLVFNIAILACLFLLGDLTQKMYMALAISTGFAFLCLPAYASGRSTLADTIVDAVEAVPLPAYLLL